MSLASTQAGEGENGLMNRILVLRPYHWSTLTLIFLKKKKRKKKVARVRGRLIRITILPLLENLVFS